MYVMCATQIWFRVPGYGIGKPHAFRRMGSRRFRSRLAGMEVYKRGSHTDEMWVDYIKNQTPPEPDDNFNVT